MARFWAMTVALMRKNMAMTSSRGGLVWDALFICVAVGVMMNRDCPDGEQGRTNGGHTSLGSCLLVYSIVNSLGFGVVSRALTYEREKRIRDVLRAMGLRDGPYYVSWALWSIWKPLASATLVAAVATSKCGSHALGLPMLYVWLLMILGLLANLSLCFLIGVVCDSVQKGALLFMVLVLAPLYSVMYGMPWQMRLFLSYIPLYGMDSALLVSEVLGGSVWATSKEHPYSFGYFLCMLAAEAVFGMLLALYLDQVLPRSWGAPPKQPLFFLRAARSRRGGSSLRAAREVIAGPASSSALLAEGFELQERLADGAAAPGAEGAEGPAELHSVARCDQVLEETDPMRGERIARGDCVAIKSLRKVFVRGDTHLVAVDTLTLYLFPGEVLCLLGHNGAGKTTAISMLTGCLQPTQGNAFVFGRPVWGENSLVENGEVGRYFGVCTQFNLMYSIMKLRLHIELICRIKGVGTERVDELIDRFELRPHQHMEAMKLSGGTVRRMNLAMAFAGTAGTGKVIVLDEPTSGVDPQSRRRIWEAIRELKRDYTILLTTHYMDEADALSDQVCIMAEGHLRCMGSPHFLKQHFGCGYNLTFDHSGPAEPIVDVVRAVTGAEPARVESALLELRVPFSASAQFKELFQRLDGERSRLQIRNFGVSVTSVEDVFLRICSNRSLTSPGGLGDQSPSTPTVGNMESPTTRGRASLREQVFALVYFRQKLQRAGWAGAAMRVVLPVVIWLVLFCMFNQTLKSIFPTKSARDIGIYKDLSRSITVFVVVLYHCLASWFELKQEDRDGIKRHLFSCGCSPWAYHMAHGISDGSLTGLSLILLLVIRRLGSALDGGARDAQALDPTAGYFSLGVFDAGSYWADFLVCPLLGFLIAVWMPLLFLVARLETRNSDAPDRNQSAEVCSNYWLMAMCGAAMVGGGLFAKTLESLPLLASLPLCVVGTTLSPFLLLSLVAAGLPGAALLAGAAAAVLRWLAAAALEVWLLSSPRGQLAYEQLRESCGMVCCLFLPMLCEFARGRLDPQAGREVLMDANAQEEAQRVREAASAGGAHKLEVSGVWKTYLTFKMGCFRSRERVTALRGVWFAADDEIFGLLGVNGAGKSSLLKIIIGQEYATEGHVSVRGSLGYCPQEDTLHARLTPWDHVELCGRLHGLSEERLVSEVAQLLDAFGLTECATQPVGHLSGGTKRRLMVCSAIIGSPDILVLDEPSCGVDPVTRRFMWRKMRSLAEARQVLLTTHSMEEAEALCARVGILSGGVLRCVGSPQALKEHYGSGRWEVNIKLIPAEADVESRMAYGRQALGLVEGVPEIPCAALAATAASLLGDPAGRRLMSAESSFPSLRDQLANRPAEGSQGAGTEAAAAPSGVTLEGLCRAYAAEAAGLALLDSCPFDYTLEEAEGMSWRLRVKLEEAHCGELFGWLEEQRAATSGGFEHTVAQTTLEHVFMSIARSQEGAAGSQSEAA